MKIKTKAMIVRTLMRATFGALVGAGYSFFVKGNIAFDIITGIAIAVIIPVIADALYGAASGSSRVLTFADPKQQSLLAAENVKDAVKAAAAATKKKK